jgi:hypothetical protein
VSAENEITSLTGIGLENIGPRGRAIFSTTNWSVVLEAQGQSPAAQEALEKLCRTYWRPVYSFIRLEGTGHEEAEDLTQAFFALLLQRRNFADVRKEKGRLRSYLLTSLKNFLVNEHRRAVTAKRGKGQQPVPLEELAAIDTGPRYEKLSPRKETPVVTGIPTPLTITVLSKTGRRGSRFWLSRIRRGSMRLTNRTNPVVDGLTTVPAGGLSLPVLETNRRELILRDLQTQRRLQPREDR